MRPMCSPWNVQQGTGRKQSYEMRGERRLFENYMKMTNVLTNRHDLALPYGQVQSSTLLSRTPSHRTVLLCKYDQVRDGALLQRW
jgi:hypothetical protein